MKVLPAVKRKVGGEGINARYWRCTRDTSNIVKIMWSQLELLFSDNGLDISTVDPANYILGIESDEGETLLTDGDLNERARLGLDGYQTFDAGTPIQVNFVRCASELSGNQSSNFRIEYAEEENVWIVANLIPDVTSDGYTSFFFENYIAISAGDA